MRQVFIFYLNFKIVYEKIILQFNIVQNGKVAQLARAFGSYPRGREFESLPCYFLCYNDEKKFKDVF